MIRFNEDALICDLAETYRIYDYRSLPASMVATLSCGLRENSRIMTALRNEKVPYNTMILARISDMLSACFYDEENRPPSLVQAFSNNVSENIESKTDIESFNSSDDFISARNKLKEANNV